MTSKKCVCMYTCKGCQSAEGVAASEQGVHREWGGVTWDLDFFCYKFCAIWTVGKRQFRIRRSGRRRWNLSGLFTAHQRHRIQAQAFWFHVWEWPRSQEGALKEGILHPLLLVLMACKSLSQTPLGKFLTMENIAQCHQKHLMLWLLASIVQ